MARQAGGHASVTHEEASGVMPNASRLFVLISCVAAFGTVLYGAVSSDPVTSIEAASTPTVTLPAAQPDDPAPTEASALPGPTVPVVTPLPDVPHVGIVAGHWEYDSGAICTDVQLTEVEINLTVARLVVEKLQARGYQVDLLREFDPLIVGYQADVLLSIHADSCVDFPDATPPASGFKVASVPDSAVPEAEARLVACLIQEYGARTQLFFHEGSITEDMQRYHSFYDVAPETPAAIIEIGFMKLDRQLLTEQPDLVAQGIIDGLVCFIEGEVE